MHQRLQDRDSFGRRRGFSEHLAKCEGAIVGRLGFEPGLHLRPDAGGLMVRIEGGRDRHAADFVA